MSSGPTAQTIDRACRQGAYVWWRGQRRIAGAATHHKAEQAGRGSVWVSLLPDYEWHQVKSTDVTISLIGTGANMETVTQINKRRRSPKTNLGAGDLNPAEGDNLVSEEADGQQRLEGMERVSDPELESLAWTVQQLQDKRMKAGEKEKERRQELTDMMVAKGVDNYPLDDEYEAVLKKSAKAYVRKIKKIKEEE